VDLFDKFDSILSQREQLLSLGVDPFSVSMDRIISQTEAEIEGRPTILAGTNNYLGLTMDPRCLEAARRTLEAEGTGTTGSRVLNGTYATHKKLEKALAEFYGTKYAMVFSTGYQANLGVISALGASKDDFILIDGDAHASIYDGCKMSNATIVRFRHNDPDDLDKRLTRLKQPDSNKLVVIEGLYSMLGDKAPIRELVAVAKKHNCYVLVDEAHSLGVMGKTGRGLTQEEGVEDQVDFIVGTFSKSVGTIGGFCVANHPKFEVLRLTSRPYMFTASLPPSVVASATEALKIIRDTPELRHRLWANASRLHAGLAAMGLDVGPEPSPVVAVRLTDPILTVKFWDALLKSGVYVNMALPPATPNGLALLRCSLCAAHTPQQVETLIARFGEAAHKLGLFNGTPVAATAGQRDRAQPEEGAAAAKASALR
jgi:glycine C-acetyltransferase/8-amino-7-oxononanoate synthase